MNESMGDIDFKMKFLSLYGIDYFFGTKVWIEYDLKGLMGIDLGNATQIRSYYQEMANNPQKWALNESYMFGFDRITGQTMMAIAPAFLMLGDPLKHLMGICLNLYYLKSDPAAR